MIMERVYKCVGAYLLGGSSRAFSKAKVSALYTEFPYVKILFYLVENMFLPIHWQILKICENGISNSSH